MLRVDKVEKDGVVKYFCVGAEPDIYYSSKEIDQALVINNLKTTL